MEGTFEPRQWAKESNAKLLVGSVPYSAHICKYDVRSIDLHFEVVNEGVKLGNVK